MNPSERKAVDETVAAASPLDDSYARLEGVFAELRPRLGQPSREDRDEGWVTGEDFVADPARRRALIDAEEELARDRFGISPRRDVAATWLFQHYLWAAGLLMSWPMALQRRVPFLAPADVALRMPFDGPVEAVIAPTRFGCLPTDPRAGHPDAEVRPDVDALREDAREVARAHFAPVLSAFAPDVRRGRWALWATATDQLVGGLWYLGMLLNDEQRGAAEAEALLPGDTPPFAGSAGFRQERRPDGAACPARMRLSCCLLYTVAPDSVCATCPRLKDNGRQRTQPVS